MWPQNRCLPVPRAEPFTDCRRASQGSTPDVARRFRVGGQAPNAGDLVQEDCGGHRRVERTDSTAHWYRNAQVAVPEHAWPDAASLAADDDRQRAGQLCAPERLLGRWVGCGYPSTCFFYLLD